MLSARQKQGTRRQLEGDETFWLVDYTTLTAKLPWLVGSDAEALALNSAGEATKNAVLTTIIIPFVLQFTMKGVMSKLWLGCQ